MNNSNLIRLKDGHGGMPWVAVHALSGTAWPYQALAECMDADQALWCLEARGLDGIHAPYDRVPAMAAYYAELVHEAIGSRPFIVFGWSFGGLVGHELTHQLRQRGAEALLAVLDCQALNPVSPIVMPSEPVLLAAFAQTLASDAPRGVAPTADELAALPNCDRRSRVIDFVLQTGRLASPEVIDYLLAVYRANLRAQSRYGPAPRRGRYALFAKAGEQAVANDDASLGWHALFPDGLTCIDVPGDHHGVLTATNVGATVRAVGEWATRACA